MFSSENNVMSFKASKKMPENQPTEPHESLSEAIVDAFAASKKRSNQMILIGAPAWVKKIIHMMHVARIAEVRDWSRLAPTRNPDEVISLVQRPRAED
jgi:hypothetical protein